MTDTIEITHRPDPAAIIALAQLALKRESATGRAALANAAATLAVLAIGATLTLSTSDGSRDMPFIAGIATGCLAYLLGLTVCARVKRAAMLKAMRADAADRGSVSMQLSATGITSQTRHGKTEIAWSGIRTFEDQPTGLGLITSGFGAVLLSDAALPEGMKREDLRTTLTTWRDAAHG